LGGGWGVGGWVVGGGGVGVFGGCGVGGLVVWFGGGGFLAGTRGEELPRWILLLTMSPPRLPHSPGKGDPEEKAF